MIENLKRVREPAAWIVLGVAVVGLVLAGVRFALALTVSDTTFSAAAQDMALHAMNLTTVAVIVALVWSCVFVRPHTPRAGLLATTSAWIVTLGTVLTLVAAVLGLRASAGAFAVVLEFLGGLLDIILKAVAATVLWLIHRGLRAGRLRGPEVPPAPHVEPAPVTSGDAAGTDQATPSPTWRPHEAAGSVWTTAEEAATGAPASQGGAPGWQPVPRQVLPGPDAQAPPPGTRNEAGPGQGPWPVDPRD